MSLPRIKDFCESDRPKAQQIYSYVKALLAKLSGITSREDQLIPVGDFFAAVEGQLEGEQRLIAEKIRELEKEGST